MTQRNAGVRELAPLLFVEDIKRSVGFYRDRLGFDVVGKWEPDDKLGWSRVQRDDASVMLQQAEEEDGAAEGRGRGVIFYFVVDDVESFHTELSMRGLHLDPPQIAFYGMKQVYLKDPDGYELCFQSPADQV